MQLYFYLDIIIVISLSIYSCILFLFSSDGKKVFDNLNFMRNFAIKISGNEKDII